ncbi:MAG: glycosyltransferase [Chloroflexales bacterium]
MRVALLTGEYPPQPGGVGDYTRRLAAALRARRHEVAVLTIQEGAFTIYRDDGHASTLRQFGTRLDWSHRAWPAVIDALAALRPAWLHIQYQTGAYALRPGLNALPWRLRGLAGHPRVAVTFHDLLVPYLFPKAGPLRAWANTRLARDADAVVATNSADAAQLQAALGGQPAPVVIPIGSNIPVEPPHGYDRRVWRTQLGVAPDALLVAYFGLLSPSKGATVLAEALARLTLPWRLLLVGGAATAPQDRAYAAAVQARLAALGLADRVLATGHVPSPIVSAHLLAADCAALPFRDGASFRRGSLLAALEHGCPVVTTTPADPATATALAPGAALLVPPDDPLALAAALARLAAEPTLGAALAAAGRRLAARFAWASIAAQHEQLYLA